MMHNLAKASTHHSFLKNQKANSSHQRENLFPEISFFVAPIHATFLTRRAKSEPSSEKSSPLSEPPAISKIFLELPCE